MIYDIDRVNVMLFKAGLPTMEQGDLKRITDRRHYSLIAVGLNRLERLYGMVRRDDDRMTRHQFRMGQDHKMTVGERVAGLEMYQELCADPRKPFRIVRDTFKGDPFEYSPAEAASRRPVDGMDERFGVPADEFRSVTRPLILDDGTPIPTPRARVPDMGVTGNAMLLLGFIAGGLHKQEGPGQMIYEVIEADPSEGWQIVENSQTGNRYRINVVQVSGIE